MLRIKVSSLSKRNRAEKNQFRKTHPKWQNKVIKNRLQAKATKQEVSFFIILHLLLHLRVFLKKLMLKINQKHSYFIFFLLIAISCMLIYKRYWTISIRFNITWHLTSLYDVQAFSCYLKNEKSSTICKKIVHSTYITLFVRASIHTKWL